MSKIQPTVIEVLRSRINSIIIPWRSSTVEPPFSKEQLVAMAMLSQTKPMTCKDILTWITTSFAYYAAKVTDAFWERSFPHYGHHNNASGLVIELRDDLEIVLRTYEFPSFVSSHDFYTVSWRIKWHAGVELIRPLMDEVGSQLKSKAGFFSLPAELRNEIYSMLFQYPTECGLSFGVTSGSPKKRFELVKESSKSRSDGAHYHHKVQTLCTRPIEQVLKPLLTSRQFYKEAMPMFYRNNHFRFDDLEDLTTFFLCTPKKRSRHLSRVSIGYPRRDRVNAEVAFGLLSKVEHLKILNLRIEETAWLRWAKAKAEREADEAGIDPRYGREKYQSALDMPGIAILRSMRGLSEVNVTGIRKDTVQPHTISTLKAELTRAKPVKAVSKPLKRKAHLDSSMEIWLDDNSTKTKDARLT